MADRLPWSKFNWDAWDTDAPLALCSMGAQGFWMRLLCLCAKEDGYLLIGGQKPSDDDLAFVTRQPAERVAEWLAELSERKVFSRDRRGVIYSRRMVADIKNAATNRKNGKKGGNPKLGKDEGNSGPDNPNSPEPVKADTESEEEQEKERSVSNETGGEPPDRTILDLSELEPKTRAWRLAKLVLVERGGMTTKAASALVGKWVNTDGLPVESLWDISEAAWRNGTDDPAAYMGAAARDTLQRGSGLTGVTNPSADRQRVWMTEFKAQPNAWKDGDRGPRPGEPGCRVSPEIQREFGVEPAKPQAIGRVA